MCQVLFPCSIPDPIRNATPTVTCALVGKMATIAMWCVCVVLLLSVQAEARSFTIDYDNDTFVKDGKPFRYVIANKYKNESVRMTPIYIALLLTRIYTVWNIGGFFGSIPRIGLLILREFRCIKAGYLATVAYFRFRKRHISLLNSRACSCIY